MKISAQKEKLLCNDILGYLTKTSENQRFSDVFRGYRNVTLEQNELSETGIPLLKKTLKYLKRHLGRRIWENF